MKRSYVKIFLLLIMLAFCSGCSEKIPEKEKGTSSTESTSHELQFEYIKVGYKLWRYDESNNKFLDADTKYDDRGNILQDYYSVHLEDGVHNVYRYYKNEYDENGNPTGAEIYEKWDDGTQEFVDEMLYENNYDFSGNLLSRCHYEIQENGPDLEITEKFYENGKLQSIEYDYGEPGDATVSYFSEYIDEYDQNGRLVRESYYYGEDVFEIYNFAYTEEGAITQININVYYPEEIETTIDYYLEYEYDDSGKIISTSCVGNSDDETIFKENLYKIGYSTILISYKYDSQGNYIETVKFCKNDGTIVRETETSYKKVAVRNEEPI